MGLNYLLHRHQVSLMRADAAATTEARQAHRELASAYAERVDAEGRAAGATAAPLVRA
jgi:hypothetical protein